MWEEEGQRREKEETMMAAGEKSAGDNENGFIRVVNNPNDLTLKVAANNKQQTTLLHPTLRA